MISARLFEQLGYFSILFARKLSPESAWQYHCVGWKARQGTLTGVHQGNYLRLKLHFWAGM